MADKSASSATAHPELDDNGVPTSAGTPSRFYSTLVSNALPAGMTARAISATSKGVKTFGAYLGLTAPAEAGNETTRPQRQEAQQRWVDSLNRFLNQGKYPNTDAIHELLFPNGTLTDRIDPTALAQTNAHRIGNNLRPFNAADIIGIRDILAREHITHFRPGPEIAYHTCLAFYEIELEKDRGMRPRYQMDRVVLADTPAPPDPDRTMALGLQADVISRLAEALRTLQGGTSKDALHAILDILVPPVHPDDRPRDLEEAAQALRQRNDRADANPFKGILAAETLEDLMQHAAAGNNEIITRARPAIEAALPASTRAELIRHIEAAGENPTLLMSAIDATSRKARDAMEVAARAAKEQAGAGKKDAGKPPSHPSRS